MQRKELELSRGYLVKMMIFYGGMTGNAVLKLITLFSRQGHSGMSASIVRDLFNKLADFKPLSVLTFEDDEWEECTGWCDDIEHYQNKRNTAVFKNGKNGKPYYINAYYLRNQKQAVLSGSLNISNDKRIRHCYIKDPLNMPSLYIDIIDSEVNKDDDTKKEPGSGWWIHKMKDKNQLKELEKCYDVEYVNNKNKKKVLDK